MKKYVAEAFGTGVLTLVVGASLAGSSPVSTPVLAALTLGLFVYSLGHVSGTHINPAVTAGLWSIGKISAPEAGKYMIGQFAGAIVALICLQTWFAMPAAAALAFDFKVGLAELLGTAIFTFGIASVVYGRTPGMMSGVVVGGSLLLGIALAASFGSLGVLNPAVALGLQVINITYVLGPVLGAIVGMRLYHALAK